MEIKIIADASKKLDKNDNNWGLSFLIDNDILFDTFSNEKILIKNFKKLKINIKQIKYVVISHDHWDHTGGLWWLLEQNKNIQLFIPEGFSNATIGKIKKYKVYLIKVIKTTEIKKDFFIFGPIKGKYKDKIIYGDYGFGPGRFMLRRIFWRCENS